MPTSNASSNQTDTNNNSNNKITNGNSEPVEPAAITVIPQQPPVIINNNNNNNIMPPTTITTRSGAQHDAADLISSIKSVAEQHQNHLRSNNHIISQQQQQQIHQLHQQQLASQQNQTANQQQPTARSLEELTALIKDINFDRSQLTNEELILLVKSHQISIYKLESFLGKDLASRCVEIRRDYYRLELAELDRLDQNGVHDRAKAFSNPCYEDLEYERVNGACCENVIGHVKVPVGLAGPLVLDGEEIYVPIATTEGCLVASTCRGLSALRKSGGVSSRIRRDFMTRAPIVRFQDPKLRDALDNVERALAWLNDKNNKEKMRAAFNLTSSHGKFINYTMYPVNREIHIRFEAQTGDAMGMNMCSKGVESALKEMQRAFPTMEIVTLSGNMCTDKKAAGINWINGRGKSVECNAELPAHVVQQVFKVSVDSMIDRWKSKVMIGSALAASIGGFNSQAANILTAIFIATGQDPAQNVTSSNCMLLLEKDSRGNLVVCCAMPSIECGTVGGGTILGDQSRYLQMMGIRGSTTRQQQQSLMPSTSPPSSSSTLAPHDQQATGGQTAEMARHNSNYNNNIDDAIILESNKTVNGIAASQQLQTGANNSSQNHGFNSSNRGLYINATNGYTNARKLARIVCATVMAGELSLLAALTEGTLVKSHMRHNRSSTNVTTTATVQGNHILHSNSLPTCFDSYNNHYHHLQHSKSKGGGGLGEEDFSAMRE